MSEDKKRRKEQTKEFRSVSSSFTRLSMGTTLKKSGMTMGTKECSYGSSSERHSSIELTREEVFFSLVFLHHPSTSPRSLGRLTMIAPLCKFPSSLTGRLAKTRSGSPSFRPTHFFRPSGPSEKAPTLSSEETFLPLLHLWSMYFVLPQSRHVQHVGIQLNRGE